MGAMQSDGGNTSPSEGKLNVDGWFSIFAAGAICCDSPDQAIAMWQVEAKSVWGAGTPVVNSLADMSRGLALSKQNALDAVRSGGDLPNGEIFGAALSLVRSAVLAPRMMFQLQVLLASATVSFSEGFVLQTTFGSAVARRFAVMWKHFASSPLLLISPRSSVPPLIEAISAVEHGKGAVRALLTAAAQGVGEVLGEIGTRLE
jgi:hypothetical protein